jgi:uncharacterized protein (TIGR02391 family)
VTDENLQVAYFDTGDRRMMFDELHPLIAEAAQGPWLSSDYPSAVKAAWFALRDLARQRLNEPNLDGAQLMERIGDTNPRLPLTEMANESERDVHRGVWRFLVGTTFYVRNPEMHQTRSPVDGDRVGAFERLVVMSICARHLDAASSPVAVDEALAEASQARFPRTLSAADDLVHSVSTGDREQLVEGLMNALAQAAELGEEEKAITLRLVYLRALHRLGPGDPPVRTAASRCERWVMDDTTLRLALLMLTSTTYSMLKPRHQDKVALLLIDDVKAGTCQDGAVSGAKFELETAAIFSGMPRHHRAGIVRALKGRLTSTPGAQNYGARLACRLAWSMEDEDQARELATDLARVIASDQASEAVTHIETALVAMPPTFVDALRDALEGQYRPDLRREHVVRRVLGDLGVELPDPHGQAGA